MLTNLKKLTTIITLVALNQNIFAAKDYDNFDLPSTGGRTQVPTSRLSYNTDKVSIRGTKVRLKEPSVNHQQFVFAKEAFLAEKRDQAIKLLRQELDTGFKTNLDNILLRLGQLYAEKYMELSFHETNIYTERLQEFEKKKAANPNAKRPEMDMGRSRRYLKDALAIFYRLEKEYPKLRQMDEVVFFIGFVEMEGGNGAKGVGYLERLIRQFPKSKKYDDAVVYLGDYYFDKQRFREANAKYRILLNRQDSALHYYAKYKLAWCELNTGEQRRAMRDMKVLIESLANQEEKAKFNLREQAIKDLVVFYGEVDEADEAFAYFEKLVGKDKALENLKLIADIYRSKGRDSAAVRAYTKLLSAFPDSPEAAGMNLGIYESMVRLGRTDQAVDVLIKALNRFGETSDWAKGFGEQVPANVKDAMEGLRAEGYKAALFHHHSAQKSSNKTSYLFALKIYNALYHNFPSHKDRKNIAFYRAEILFNQGKWLDAANSYMEAAKIAPKDKLTDECVYNALLAMDKLTAKNEKIERYSKEEMKKVSLEKEEIPDAEKRFIEVAEYYIREYPQGQRIVDVRFRVAAIHYKYHHFDEALEGFKGIATKYPRHRSATTSAHIVLDIHNIKKDFESLNAAALTFAGTEGLGDAEFRKEMAQINSEVGFKQIEKLEAGSKWDEAGEAYLAAFRANPSGPLAEKSLYNAFVSFEKSGQTTKAVDVSKMFVSKFPKSEYTSRLTLVLARLAEKQYDFELAQRYYSDFSKKFPKDKEARKSLFNAAVFAELLEKNKEALELYEQYSRGGMTSDEKLSITLSQAKLYRREGKWDKVTQIYRRLAQNARSMNERIGFLGELARQYERGGRVAERTAILNEIRALSQSGKGLKVDGAAIQYVAEANFKSITPQREKYEKVKLRFPPEDLIYLIKTKQRLLTKLADSYDKVVEIGVPDWGVAALYEKAESYVNFVKNYRTVEIPKRFQGAEREEAEKSLKAIDEKMIKPLEEKSKEIFTACANRASQFHVANEFASKCRSRVKSGADADVEVAGLIPQPSYWSTRSFGSGEVVKK